MNTMIRQIKGKFDADKLEVNNLWKFIDFGRRLLWIHWGKGQL